MFSDEHHDVPLRSELEAPAAEIQMYSGFQSAGFHFVSYLVVRKD